MSHRPAPNASASTLRVVEDSGVIDNDDGELVRAAIGGDRSAAHRLYDKHAPRVAMTLRRTLGSDHDVADLLHDAFLVVLERLDTLENPALFRFWVTRIAVFQARRLIRKRARHRWLRLVSGEDPVQEPVTHPPSDDVDEALRATYELLESIPEDERIAFVLRRLDGMGVGEIAVVCGVSLSTAKRRIGRAEELFRAGVPKHPVLKEWLEGATA